MCLAAAAHCFAMTFPSTTGGNIFLPASEEKEQSRFMRLNTHKGDRPAFLMVLRASAQDVWTNHPLSFCIKLKTSLNSGVFLYSGS